MRLAHGHARPIHAVAIELPRAGMVAGEGGPFGAVGGTGGCIVGEGCNQGLAQNDPTAHGEIVAIRD